MTDRPPPHVVLLATGGTIASRAQRTPDGATVAADDGMRVLSSLQSPTAYPVRVVDVSRQGSYLLTFDDMLAICRAVVEALSDPMALGVVVTHGTDTMEETAFLVDLIHDDPRPIVFTGAQRAADSPEPDGPDNLARAIAVAGSIEARGRGVLLCFAGRIFPARGVRKTHTRSLDAFANPDFGPAGSVTETGEVRMGESLPRADALPLPTSGADHLRVDMVATHPGADSVLLRASLAAGAAGVVLQGTGNGNANPSMCEAVAEAAAAGVVVVASTRVHAGPVVPVYGNGGGKDLVAAGAIPSGLLRPSQSLILLGLLLRTGASHDEIARTFSQRGAPP